MRRRRAAPTHEPVFITQRGRPRSWLTHRLTSARSTSFRYSSSSLVARRRSKPAADAEFLAVITYIGADSPAAAAAFRDKALHSLSRLRDFVAPYRFFYQVKVDTWWIAAVWHSARLVHPPADEVGGE